MQMGPIALRPPRQPRLTCSVCPWCNPAGGASGVAASRFSIASKRRSSSPSRAPGRRSGLSIGGGLVSHGESARRFLVGPGRPGVAARRLVAAPGAGAAGAERRRRGGGCHRGRPGCRRIRAWSRATSPRVSQGLEDPVELLLDGTRRSSRGALPRCVTGRVARGLCHDADPRGDDRRGGQPECEPFDLREEHGVEGSLSQRGRPTPRRPRPGEHRPRPAPRPARVDPPATAGSEKPRASDGAASMATAEGARPRRIRRWRSRSFAPASRLESVPSAMPSRLAAACRDRPSSSQRINGPR